MSSPSYVGCQRDAARICCRAPCVMPTAGAVAIERLRFLSLSISCPRSTQQQTRRGPLLLSMDGKERQTDRWTDAQSLHRPCSAYADSVNKTALSEKRSGKTIFETVAMCGKTRLLVKYFQRFLSKPHYPQFRRRLDHTSVIGRLTAISRDCRLISVFAEMSVTRQTEHL